MFVITGDNGFQIAFKNSITLSTKFGWGNYCSGFDKVQIGPDREIFSRQSEDVEISIFDGGIKQKWLTKQAYKEIFNQEIDGLVKGDVKIAEWLAVFDWCRTYNPERRKEGEEE